MLVIQSQQIKKTKKLALRICARSMQMLESNKLGQEQEQEQGILKKDFSLIWSDIISYRWCMSPPSAPFIYVSPAFSL